MIMLKRLLAAGTVLLSVACASPQSSPDPSAVQRDHSALCRGTRNALRQWWPPVLKAVPARSYDTELRPWQNPGLATALTSLIPVNPGRDRLPYYLVNAADDITVLGVVTGPAPLPSVAVHKQALKDLRVSLTQMHYICPVSVSSSYATGPMPRL